MLTLSVEEFPTATEDGLNVAEAPDGNPATEREAVPIPPSTAVVATLKLALPPCVTVLDDGVAESNQPGNGTGQNINVP